MFAGLFPHLLAKHPPRGLPGVGETNPEAFDLFSASQMDLSKFEIPRTHL